MAIPGPVARVTISGQLQTFEIWATSFWVTGYDTDSASLETLITTSGAWPDFLDSLAASMSTGDVIERVKVTHYSGAGMPDNTAQYDFVQGGTVGSPVNPKFTACVMTLRSLTLTRRGRGRMYLPATGVAVDTLGAFNATRVDDLVDKTAALLGVYSLLGGQAVVCSQTDGTNFAIESVDADYVPDVQRRRKNKQTTLRHSASL